MTGARSYKYRRQDRQQKHKYDTEDSNIYCSFTNVKFNAAHLGMVTYNLQRNNGHSMRQTRDYSENMKGTLDFVSTGSAELRGTVASENYKMDKEILSIVGFKPTPNRPLSYEVNILSTRPDMDSCK